MSDADSPVDPPVDTVDHRDDEPEDKQDEHERVEADSDDESALSDLEEEADLGDYDPETVQLEERPVNIDEDMAKTLKASKRKRADGSEAAAAARKPKEGRRAKKRRTDDDIDDPDPDGEVLEGKRARKGRAEGAGGERRSKQQKPPPEEENEENLTPEERRRRAIERAIDGSLKKPKTRRTKKDEVDLEDEADEIIADLKVHMERACVADNEARDKGEPATNKLKLLPRVLAILNRQNIQNAVLDPENNFLQGVRFFLEPLNDGSLPAYSIQRDLFQAISRLPIEKEALASSGLGKVVLFYTRSKRPEGGIKRIAERLLGEWSRPILKRTDDYKKRRIETRDYDFTASNPSNRSSQSQSQLTLTQRPGGAGAAGRHELEKQRMLAPVVSNPNRARPAALPQAYTVAPVSSFDQSAARAQGFRPMGAGGMDAFRKMTQKGKKKQ